jgi:[acyl-carrier-protein] S-malonyltransferase
MVKKAFIFPGQGSQTVGMAKEFYDNFSAAKQVFNEVNDSLNKDLAKIMFEDPENVLVNTENSQPAIMTASMAILEVLKQETGLTIAELCDFVAGHSLGEYTALCASESLTLGDTAKLLKIRGEAFAEASRKNAGMMVSLLGATPEQVENLVEKSRITGEILQIANDNTVGQVVISGNIKSIENAMELSKELAIKKVVKLQVSGAFHSKLMEPAIEKMQEALEDVEINRPKVGIIANYTAKVENENEIKKNLLKQITGMVRWRDTMLNMQGYGVEVFVEVGNGKVLTGMVPRTCPDVKSIAVNSIESLEEFKKELK